MPGQTVGTLQLLRKLAARYADSVSLFLTLHVVSLILAHHDNNTAEVGFHIALFTQMWPQCVHIQQCFHSAAPDVTGIT